MNRHCLSARFQILFALCALSLSSVIPAAAQDDDAKLRPAEPDYTVVNLPTTLPLPLHVSELAVGGAEVGSEPELVWLMVGSLLLATVMILRRKRWFV